MRIHKLTAGSGYDYLTRQIAALDATPPAHALSVFSGGPYVYPERDYPAKVAALFPHGRPGPGSHPTLFCDWPNTPFVGPGTRSGAP